MIRRVDIIKLLTTYATKYGIKNGKEIWIRGEYIIIQLSEEGDIPYDIFESIALNQLEINIWQLDYWMGENNVIPY